MKPCEGLLDSTKVYQEMPSPDHHTCVSRAQHRDKNTETRLTALIVAQGCRCNGSMESFSVS